MIRTAIIAALAVLPCAMGGMAMASASATGQATVNIERPAGIQVVNNLLLPSINGANATADGARGSNAATAATVVSTSNATLTIHGQSGDAVSMAVPTSIQVIRAGGTETLTVKTNTNAEFGVAGNGVVLGGGRDIDTMSVNVGGALASTGDATPGPYEGLLVVVVQYN